MQYEAIPKLSKKEIREILFSSSLASEEEKSLALFSSIYNQDEYFSAEVIIDGLRSGIWNDQIRVARVVEPFMQSRMSVAGVKSIIEELKRLEKENTDYTSELSEITDTVLELKEIILKNRANS